jgi:small subunit ribosomal protein S6
MEVNDDHLPPVEGAFRNPRMSEGGDGAHMRTYELMTIHRPEMSDDDVRKEMARLEEFLGEGGATVQPPDFWGKRRLAYEIDHINEGYYTVLTFDAEPTIVADLDRVLHLADTVIRHKVVRPE